jgi:hypothetical protein
MATYYKNRPKAPGPTISNDSTRIGNSALTDAPALSEYDRHRLTLLSNDVDEGWTSELRRYLGTVQHDVGKDTDIVEWWQVSSETATNILAHNLSHRTILKYIQRLLKLRWMYFHRRLPPFRVNGSFRVQSK